MFGFCEKSKGAISVFLTLILLPTLLLGGLTTDAARIYMSKVVISDAGEMAMNAGLAQYETELHDEYGLFSMEKTPEDMEDDLADFFNKSLNGKGLDGTEDYDKILDLITENFNAYNVEGSQIYKSEVEKQQIVEYMKYRAPVCLTEELLDKSTMGKDHVPDMLALTYYAGNYAHKSVQECAMEMQDTYVRLDRSIASLLDIIDKKVGLQNVVFFITSTGYTDTESPDLGLYRVPTGEFHLNRCAALLNMYLMATYGQGQYVEAYYDQQIYLNHKLIEEKQLNLADIQEKAAEFLIQFSGVNEVYSGKRLLLGSWTPDISMIRNSFHRKRSGDLLIDVLPGWSIVNENTSDHKVVRKAHIPSPLIFMGSGVKPAVINTPVTIDHIAPTVAHILRIRSPNACSVTPITDIR